ncbi:MAG: saccharopine dehydrogenase NADP-binding domain-containing protein [Gammaproteobacteria bacterium]|nr:saccharopine dehydrogenase NADP-binding domain-containing protein [Gammaproteobacteria bacterium]
MYRILVLGGYGNFGARIVRSLATYPNVQLIVAGRNISKAKKIIASLDTSTTHEATFLDQTDKNFVNDLNSLDIDCLVHTSGPYQGQGYDVAKACINTKTHYIDLADGREFVNNFSTLDKQAKDNNALLITGASTLPGLSSAVIHNFNEEFKSIDSIRICIAPGNQAPRGGSTIDAVLTYCGKPVKCWINGQWRTKYGWQDLHIHQFPNLGRRMLGLCDVPDLSLFPEKYPEVKTVLFHAALETKISQLGFWAIAAMTRIRLIQNPNKLAPLVYKLGELTNFMGTPHGGMFVIADGVSKDNQNLELAWHLTALNGHGPEIPTIPAIILAKKLADDKIHLRGATACTELITLDEFDKAVEHLDISWEVVRS